MSGDFIALDWGTSSFRAYLVGADGSVRNKRESAEGIMSVTDGGFEPVFERHVAGWDAALPVLASGMITSRQGWREVAYVPAPAGLAELAAGVLRFRTESGRDVIFLPGVSYIADRGVPDVMRGEETQIVGALTEPNGVFVTRGTHCKWVRVENGRIAQFSTFMTGEMFAVLKDHSILGRLMTGQPSAVSSFEKGVAAGLHGEQQGAGLLHSLFSVRTLALFDRIAGNQLESYLSGLLTGAEIASASKQFPARADGVTVIGAPALAAPFRGALIIAGIASRPGPEDAAVRGLARIGRHIGAIA